jgi:hypothetical protein
MNDGTALVFAAHELGSNSGPAEDAQARTDEVGTQNTQVMHMFLRDIDLCSLSATEVPWFVKIESGTSLRRSMSEGGEQAVDVVSLSNHTNR